MSPGSISQPDGYLSHLPPPDSEDSDSSEKSNSDTDDDSPPVRNLTLTPVSADKEVLGLPSDFNPEERKTYNIELLATYETKLHIGQAFDTLEKICEAVKHLSAFIEKKKEAHAVADHVRSNDITKFSIAYCQKLAQSYNRNFDRLLTLQGVLSTLGSSHPVSRLQRIDLANDLKVANLKKALFEDVMDCIDVSDTSQQLIDVDSRANKTVGHVDITYADRLPKQASGRMLYTMWFDRAQWFRVWQEKCHYNEAVNILCAEFRATNLGFAAMGNL
ncbi:hypothetical protein GSI_10365 [Ganoderma sinense ZZ0214-1]|uniref:Uncharacterized protein n=1 Tax=Ganoderma sinense ZZ0214-1 TaxID=1077348 RepID=A0A2G8S0D4_9APHY|nr:hypothetical protein GSI_10365 [Ganoderma sinense ZZ0214-1]